MSSPESEINSLNFKETELTLCLPGESRLPPELGAKTRIKCGYSECISKNLAPVKPPEKSQVVGWPPVRGYRRNAMKSCKYVKVAVDGAPYLRKVDLQICSSYQHLFSSLEDLFSFITIGNYGNEMKIMDSINGTEHVATYEDKEGDWMLVGDVPWNMFVESCKRIRLMKSSDANGLRTQENGSLHE